MERNELPLPYYAHNALYKLIDDFMTSFMVFIYDTLNTGGIKITEQQLREIMAKNQTQTGGYKSFIEEFFVYFNNLIKDEYPIIGYILLCMTFFVAYKIIMYYYNK